MIKVILESPYAGDIVRNVDYARRCMHDCFKRGEAPFASHLLYTQPGILDDNVPGERALGIEAGLQWGSHAERTVVYADLGFSKGMEMGITRAMDECRPVEFRMIDSKYRLIGYVITRGSGVYADGSGNWVHDITEAKLFPVGETPVFGNGLEWARAHAKSLMDILKCSLHICEVRNDENT